MKLIRYKWFGINHGGISDYAMMKNAHIPNHSLEFAQPCECFNNLGTEFTLIIHNCTLSNNSIKITT